MVSSVLSKLFTGALVILILLTTGPATAQSPFGDCADRSETNASVILPADMDVRLDGKKHEKKIRIGVFTPSGRCTGSTDWNGQSAALTAWGTSETRTTSSARSTVLTPGDTIHVHLYNPATQTEYTVHNSRISISFRNHEPHLTSHGRYVPQGIYVVDRIRVDASFASRSD